MKKSTLIATLCFAFAMTGAAFAQQQSTTPQGKKTPVVNQRQKDQQTRIIQGAKSGQLTRKETSRLERQQVRIQTTKLADKANNGGKLTPQEKRHLNKMQNHASRHIYRAKHNYKVRH